MQFNMRRTVLLLTLVLLAAPLAAQDWAGRGRALGKVVDEQGNPVEGAKVTLHLPGFPEAGPEPLLTDKKGRWSYLGLDNGAWAVVIEKEGFITSEGSFSVNEFGTARPLKIELQRNPFDAVAAGQALIDEGRYEEARQKFLEVLPEMDGHQQAQLHALIGNTHYAENAYAKAREEYQQALPGLTEGERTSVLLRLGDSYMQEGQYDKAREAYESTVEQLGPDGRSQVLLAIARSYDQEGSRDEAIAAVERILEGNPNDIQALQLIADLLSRQGREDEAQAYLDRVPEGAELPADMLLNQGIRFYNDQKLDEALVNFERVIRQDSALADAYYYRGLVYLNRGENEPAIADFKKLLELAPDSQYASDAKQFLEYLESE